MAVEFILYMNSDEENRSVDRANAMVTIWWGIP